MPLSDALGAIRVPAAVMVAPAMPMPPTPDGAGSSVGGLDSAKRGALWKTRLCRHWMASNGQFCPMGDHCSFAHGAHELRANAHILAAAHADAVRAQAATNAGHVLPRTSPALAAQRAHQEAVVMPTPGSSVSHAALASAQPHAVAMHNISVPTTTSSDAMVGSKPAVAPGAPEPAEGRTEQGDSKRDGQEQANGALPASVAKADMASTLQSKLLALGSRDPRTFDACVAHASALHPRLAALHERLRARWVSTLAMQLARQAHELGMVEEVCKVLSTVRQSGDSDSSSAATSLPMQRAMLHTPLPINSSAAGRMDSYGSTREDTWSMDHFRAELGEPSELWDEPGVQAGPGPAGYAPAYGVWQHHMQYAASPGMPE